MTASFWTTVKAVVAKKLNNDSSAVPREDENLPFGVRVGSLITLNAGPFLRAHGSLVAQPPALSTVVAISRIRMRLDGALYRLYVSKGDNVADKEAYIQVYVDAQGQPQEMHYFDRILRIFPDTPETIAAFTGENEEGLGRMDFSLFREQMEDLGYAEAALNDAFGENDELVYTRLSQSDRAYVAPFEATENRIDDSHGKQGLRQKVLFMPFGRELGNTSEQLVIATEIVHDQNGVSVDDVHVDFMVGLPLGTNDIRIQ